MCQPRHNIMGKYAYALFPKVLSTPTSGISPEKKLVDKFLRQAHKLAYTESQSYDRVMVE